MKIIIYHSFYGCDTGCCGHVVEFGDDERFFFDHPAYKQDYLEFAKELIIQAYGEEHIKDLDWENCKIGYD